MTWFGKIRNILLSVDVSWKFLGRSNLFNLAKYVPLWKIIGIFSLVFVLSLKAHNKSKWTSLVFLRFSLPQRCREEKVGDQNFGRTLFPMNESFSNGSTAFLVMIDGYDLKIDLLENLVLNSLFMHGRWSFHLDHIWWWVVGIYNRAEPGEIAEQGNQFYGALIPMFLAHDHHDEKDPYLVAQDDFSPNCLLNDTVIVVGPSPSPHIMFGWNIMNIEFSSKKPSNLHFSEFYHVWSLPF